MKALLVLILGLFLLLGANSMAQNDIRDQLPYLLEPLPFTLDFTGGGARAKGMGNAFIGVADDISAVSWNPAGLYRINDPYVQPALSVGFNSFKSNSNYDFTSLDQSFEQSETFSGVDLASFLAPVRVKGHPFVVAGSYTRLDDEYTNGGFLYDTYVDYTPLDDVTDTNLFRQIGSAGYHSAVYAVNFGFGTRVYTNLTFGASINIYSGKATRQEVYVSLQDGVTPPDLSGQPVIQVTEITTTDTLSFSGTYFLMGLRYTGEKFSAGLVVKTPHALKQTNDSKLASVNSRNGNVEPDDTETIFWDDNVTELDMPFVIGGGVGYQVTEKLLLALDAEYRAFSGSEINVRDSIRLNPGEKDTEFFTSSDPQWNNVLTIRAGAEYLWHTGSATFPLVPLRAGFGYVPIPSPNVTGDDIVFDTTAAAILAEPDLYTESAAMTNISLGTGLHWDQIHLDFAYTNRSLDREDTKRLVQNNPYFQSETSTTDHIFNVTFTGFF
ncbi:MAG: hypothetical protein GY867_08855 [bacterium]|nr:hypothetical protein [bacterium]